MLKVYWKEAITEFGTDSNDIHFHVWTPYWLERILLPKVPPQIPSKTGVNIIISSLQIRKIQDIINTFHIFLITNLLKKNYGIFIDFLFIFFIYLSLVGLTIKRTCKTTFIRCFCSNFEHLHLSSVYCNVSF